MIKFSQRTPAEGEGHEGFPPPPEKDLESPPSTRLMNGDGVFNIADIIMVVNGLTE